MIGRSVRTITGRFFLIFRGKFRSRGMSLVEVLVALAIMGVLSSGLIGTFRLLLYQQEQQKSQLTALYLAQECVETLRNKRDSAHQNAFPWDCGWEYDTVGRVDASQFSAENSDSPPQCFARWGSRVEFPALAAESDPDFFRLYQAPSQNYWTHQRPDDSYAPTAFYRQFSAEKIDSEDSAAPAQLRCKVWWEGGKKVVEIPFLLTDWQ